CAWEVIILSQTIEQAHDAFLSTGQSSLTISATPDGLAAASQVRIRRADNFGLPTQSARTRDALLFVLVPLVPLFSPMAMVIMVVGVVITTMPVVPVIFRPVIVAIVRIGSVVSVVWIGSVVSVRIIAVSVWIIAVSVADSDGNLSIRTLRGNESQSTCRQCNQEKLFHEFPLLVY